MSPASPTRTASAARRRDRRPAALAASMAFHLACGFALLGAAAGDLITGGGLAGGDDGPAITVTLVGADLVPPSAATGATLNLRVRPGADAAPIWAAQAPEDLAMTRLLQTVRTQAAQKPAEPEGARPAGARSVTPQTNGLDEIDRSIRGPDGAATSAGGLWGQIVPCWRALPVAARTPVSLEVTLDSSGGLSRPPRIIRPPNEAVPDARLKAEAQALAALSACMPRHDMRFAGGVYRLDFGPHP